MTRRGRKQAIMDEHRELKRRAITALGAGTPEAAKACWEINAQTARRLIEAERWWPPFRRRAK